MRLTDESLYRALYGDPEIMRYIGPAMSAKRAARAFRLSLKDQRAGHRIEWAFKDTHGEAFAICGLVRGPANEHPAHIGCLLLAHYHGRGYATELLAAVVEYAFRVLRIHSLTSISTRTNVASFVFMQKLGFSYSSIDEMPHRLGAGYRWHLRLDHWASLTARKGS